MTKTSLPDEDGLRMLGEDFSLVGRVSSALREEIVSGELAAKSRLKTEEIARRFGVSTIPVREALRALATEGLVTPSVNKGYRVRSAGPGDLEETYNLRALLDPLAVQLAVPNLTQQDLDILASRLEDMRLAMRNIDALSYWRHHQEFHFTIYRRCEQSWLLRFVNALYTNSDRYRPSIWKPSGARDAEHLQVLEACRLGDAVAAAGHMQAHLTHTYALRLPMFAEAKPKMPTDAI